MARKQKDVREELFDDPNEYKRQDNRKKNHNHRDDRKEKLGKRYQEGWTE